MITIVIGICAFISGVILGAGVGTYRMGEKVKGEPLKLTGRFMSPVRCPLQSAKGEKYRNAMQCRGLYPHS